MIGRTALAQPTKHANKFLKTKTFVSSANETSFASGTQLIKLLIKVTKINEDFRKTSQPLTQFRNSQMSSIRLYITETYESFFF